MYTILDSWWWTENLSETCRVLFQNKFEKLEHLVGFIIRIYHDAWSCECQNRTCTAKPRHLWNSFREKTINERISDLTGLKNQWHTKLINIKIRNQHKSKQVCVRVYWKNFDVPDWNLSRWPKDVDLNQKHGTKITSWIPASSTPGKSSGTSRTTMRIFFIAFW